MHWSPKLCNMFVQFIIYRDGLHTWNIIENFPFYHFSLLVSWSLCNCFLAYCSIYTFKNETSILLQKHVNYVAHLNTCLVKVWWNVSPDASVMIAKNWLKNHSLALLTNTDHDQKLWNMAWCSLLVYNNNPQAFQLKLSPWLFVLWAHSHDSGI